MTEVITKAEISAVCKKEGIACAYSGKIKTFYLSALPSGINLFRMDAMGFNVQVNKQRNF